MKSIEADQRGLLVSCPNCGQRNRLLYERLGQAFRCGKCHNVLQPPSEPIEVPSDLVFESLTAHSSLPVLVDFWASWCGPCKMVAPEIAKLAREDAGHFLVVKVNTEESQSLARKFRISAIPTMILFRSGLEVARQAGAMPAPAIRRFVAPWIATART
jgi:thioredoxin 2